MLTDYDVSGEVKHQMERQREVAEPYMSGFHNQSYWRANVTVQSTKTFNTWSWGMVLLIFCKTKGMSILFLYMIYPQVQ